MIIDVEEIRDKLSNNLDYVLVDECVTSFSGATMNLSEEVERTSGDPVRPNEPIQYTDPLVYIYTSGTTGLPKAAIMTHIRFELVNTRPSVVREYISDVKYHQVCDLFLNVPYNMIFAAMALICLKNFF